MISDEFRTKLSGSRLVSKLNFPGTSTGEMVGDKNHAKDDEESKGCGPKTRRDSVALCRQILMESFESALENSSAASLRKGRKEASKLTMDRGIRNWWRQRQGFVFLCGVYWASGIAPTPSRYAIDRQHSKVNKMVIYPVL